MSSRWISVALVISLTTAAQADPLEELALRVMEKLQAYQRNSSNVRFESATGLWVAADDPDYYVTQLAAGEVVASWVVAKTGDRLVLGFGEGRFGEWKGYWKYACRGCCPGHDYARPGIQRVSDDRTRATITIAGHKPNEETCQLTTTPLEHVYDLKRVRMLEFREHLPGKLIHIVAAPAVGSQAAQYKASVKVAWNARHLGVSKVSLVRPGSMVFENSSQLEGVYEHLTDRPGRLDFVFVAYDKNSQPLHVEMIGLDIPSIPGL